MAYPRLSSSFSSESSVQIPRFDNYAVDIRLRGPVAEFSSETGSNSWLPMVPDHELPTPKDDKPGYIKGNTTENRILCQKSPRFVLDALYFPTSGEFIGYRGFPTYSQCTQLIAAYVETLSSVKKHKSLITKQMYDDIRLVLLDSAGTSVGSAQFRFWAKKNFALFREDSQGRVLVMHKHRPVAVREELYMILSVCHMTCNHGGRDKTLGQLREWHSRVPKNLISQFIKLCPTCNPAAVSQETHPEFDYRQLGSRNLMESSLNTCNRMVLPLRKSIVSCKLDPNVAEIARAARCAATAADVFDFDYPVSTPAITPVKSEPLDYMPKFEYPHLESDAQTISVRTSPSSSATRDTAIKALAVAFPVLSSPLANRAYFPESLSLPSSPPLSPLRPPVQHPVLSDLKNVNPRARGPQSKSGKVAAKRQLKPARRRAVGIRRSSRLS
ncbi:hypothetical protein V1512DRAFT_292940 [Lipomyces arxii]|uniref:uncharacterized protein n=1 Tax=Lipomyces arxii TaxID=56418 RepID=UPI0034CF2A75